MISVGSSMMWLHQQFESKFQYALLAVLGTDYHWQSIGNGYFSFGTVIAGAFLMALAACIAVADRVLEWPNAVTKDAAEPVAGTSRGDRQRDPDGDGGKHARCGHTGIWEL